MMVEISKTQDDMVGDGTTTTVVLAGESSRKQRNSSTRTYIQHLS